MSELIMEPISKRESVEVPQIEMTFGQNESQIDQILPLITLTKL